MSHKVLIPAPDIGHPAAAPIARGPADNNGLAHEAAPRLVGGKPGRRATLLRSVTTGTARAVGTERRATRQALSDWQQLSIDGLPPSLRDLAPHRNPASWADRFLLACDPDPARCVFVLCGERVEQAFGQRLIGQTLCAVAPRQTALIEACTRAMQSQAPAEVEDSYRIADGRRAIYRAAFMPVRGADLGDGYLMGAYGALIVAG
jgi:hypothetical protein